MDLLASYDDENTGENSLSASPKVNTDTISSQAPDMLENEWLSFEQMIAPGGIVGNVEPVKKNDFLVDGVVAYPGMKKVVPSLIEPEIASVVQSTESSDSEEEQQNGKEKDGDGMDEEKLEKNTEEDDDAFLRLRKQVKARDRSSSSDSSSSSSSSSSSRSGSPNKGTPSPPHLSPVNSVRSHTSEPPDLMESETIDEKPQPLTETARERTSEANRKSEPRSKSKDRKSSRDRKLSHRERSKHHDHHSSKRHRSRSHSKDRKHRHSSRDRHTHKRKKSKDRKPSRRSKERSKSHERKDNKNDSSTRKDNKSDSLQRKDGKVENTEKKEVVAEVDFREESLKKDIKNEKEEKNESSRKNRSKSRSKERRDKKERKRSVSRDRKRGRSKDRKRSRSKERKRSRSKERKSSTSKEKNHKIRSRSKDRRSRSRHRSRERHSRSRSRERLRSRSPIPGRKLTFKEQMRKQFINASKGMCSEKAVELERELPIKRTGEPLKPSDLLKGIKLTGGESVTPQMALIQTMAAMHKKAQELTGVEVPKYYNPAAVNPLKYAEQVQKRKLLWSKKPTETDKNEQIETQWKSAFMASDDGKTASKFRKLMGMRNEEESVDVVPEEIQKLSEEQKRKQQELFERLDQEYQFARMTTHTQRGVGLGFATTVIDPNHPSHRPNQPPT